MASGPTTYQKLTIVTRNSKRSKIPISQHEVRIRLQQLARRFIQCSRTGKLAGFESSVHHSPDV